MSKPRLQPLLLCALILVAHAQAGAQRAKRGAGAKPCAVAGVDAVSEDKFEALLSRARAGGPVQVIVRLCVAFRPEGELSDAAARRQRASIARAQDSLLKELRGARVRRVRKFIYTPFVAMTADAAALLRLRSSAAVANVEEDAALPAASR
jgi:hypothetical protein